MIVALVTFAQIEKIAIFLIVLSLLVVLHEYGHFLIARLNGVRVLEFAVGMGPKLAGWTSRRSGTLYSLRALPIGGFCQMQGEDGKTSEAEQQRDFRSEAVADGDNFQAKSAWRRLGIVAAGPLANFIVAFAILLGAGLIFGAANLNVSQPRIGQLIPGSPAARAGMQTGDRILSVDGVAIAGGRQLVALIHASRGKLLHVTYTHDGAQNTVGVRPAACPATPPNNPKNGCIGFLPLPEYTRVGFATAFRNAAYDFSDIAIQTVGSLALLVGHPQQYAPQMSGVVGMGQAAMTIQDFGWGYYLRFAALISFALGLFNLLPIPALDGGRGAFIVAELVRGKPVDPEREALVHVTGFAILIALMIAINFYNVVRIVQGHGPFN